MNSILFYGHTKICLFYYLWMGLWAVPRFGFLWGKWLDQTRGTCMFIFVLQQCFPKWSYCFTFQATVMKFPVLPLPGQHLVWFIFLNFNHSNRCIVISHCGFNLCVLIQRIWAFFMHLFAIHMSSLVKGLFKSGAFLLGCLYSH